MFSHRFGISHRHTRVDEWIVQKNLSRLILYSSFWVAPKTTSLLKIDIIIYGFRKNYNNVEKNIEFKVLQIFVNITLNQEARGYKGNKVEKLGER